MDETTSLTEPESLLSLKIIREIDKRGLTTESVVAENSMNIHRM